MGTNDEEIFFRTLARLESSEKVRMMQKFSQHKGNNTFQHCKNVALCSFYLAEKLGWKIDEEALATGAMLHDYYLYNTTEMTMSDFRHGISHPKLAYENASKIWDLSDKERNIILSHMWPLTLVSFPHSKEAFLVTLADKYCAVREMSSAADAKAIDPRVHTPWIRTNIVRIAKSAIAG